MPKPKTDPLLAALIAKLPPVGDEWPVEAQLNWLHLTAMAFGTIYGGDASRRLVGVVTGSPAPDVKYHSPQPAKPAKPKYDFYIDEQGVAFNAKGKRINAKDVAGTLFDLRGIDGDVKTIQWADGSVGLNGADLTISAV